jgi:hypothetical protein
LQPPTLGNYEVTFTTLQQQVDSIDDSKYKIVLLIPAQFNFSLQLSSITFQSQMLQAANKNQILKEVAL